MATNDKKSQARSSESQENKGKTTVEQGNTRSDVGTDANPAVDATRVHTVQSDNRNGEEITADNAAELMTENEVAERNKKMRDIGTDREDPEFAKNFNL